LDLSAQQNQELLTRPILSLIWTLAFCKSWTDPTSARCGPWPWTV
jgi:ribonuclease I